MKIIHFDEIDSTNTYLINNHDNLSDLTICEADYQSQGKGREDRTWLANKNENVMFSILIKDKDLLEQYNALSMLIALLVRNYLSSLEIDNVSIKWPNDVYVNGKKIAGILLEGNVPNYVVVGVGLNLNQNEFDNDLRHPATSFKLEKPEYNSSSLVESQEIIYRFNSLWADFKGDWLMYDDFIKEHNYLLKKRIKLIDGSRIIIGIVEDIDSQCNLLINIDKEIVKINTGEIIEIV